METVSFSVITELGKEVWPQPGWNEIRILIMTDKPVLLGGLTVELIQPPYT